MLSLRRDSTSSGPPAEILTNEQAGDSNHLARVLRAATIFQSTPSCFALLFLRQLDLSSYARRAGPSLHSWMYSGMYDSRLREKLCRIYMWMLDISLQAGMILLDGVDRQQYAGLRGCWQ